MLTYCVKGDVVNDLKVQTLLDKLASKGVLTERSRAEAFILCEENLDHIPIYVHVLIGFGALFGCFSLIGLISASGIIDWNNHLLVMTIGLIAVGAAIAINYALRDSDELLHSFSLQLTCILMLIGKVLFIWSAAQALEALYPMFKMSWLVTFSMIFIILPTYFLFPVALDRFLSSFVLICTLFICALYDFPTNILFYVAYCALMVLVGYLLNDKHKHHSLEALTYASVAALGVCAIYLTGDLDFVMATTKISPIPLIMFNLTLALALIIQCFTIKTSPPPHFIVFITGCIALLVLSIISTNGILYAIGLMILGYEKHRRNFIIMGVVFLTFFIIEYYYSLSLSLAHKAAILAGSGGILLIARMILQHEHWDQHHD